MSEGGERERSGCEWGWRHTYPFYGTVMGRDAVSVAAAPVRRRAQPAPIHFPATPRRLFYVGSP